MALVKEGNRFSQTKEKHRGGAKCRVTAEELKVYVDAHPNVILADIAEHFGFTIPGIFYHLRKHGYVRKKTLRYVERNESKRQLYLEKIANIPTENIVYIDESGICHQDIKQHCWTKKGNEIIGERQGSQRARTNVIAAENGENINAPMTYSGTMDGNLFLFWLKNFLTASLKKGQVVIMDNASIHKVKQVKEIIEEAGCSLLYLPPYSPDFNPIEQYWAVMKSNIKKIRSKFKCIQDAIDHTLKKTKRHFNT
ncbi:MAG: IS630 family transposase [Mariprofundaceae bacterium]|nr:IS630 family transposase [Mariprofundaceae bacterium]